MKNLQLNYATDFHQIFDLNGGCFAIGRRSQVTTVPVPNSLDSELCRALTIAARPEGNFYQIKVMRRWRHFGE